MTTHFLLKLNALRHREVKNEAVPSSYPGCNMSCWKIMLEVGIHTALQVFTVLYIQRQARLSSHMSTIITFFVTCPSLQR